MNNTLVIVINDYPYNIGEPFFETELPFLAKVFDTILIFSVNGKDKEKQTRQYPKNVFCFPLNCSHNRFKYVFKGLFNLNNQFSLKGINLKKKISSLYILGKNVSIYKKIKKILSRYIQSINKITVYSYWLTLGISCLKLQKYLYKKLNKKVSIISRTHGYDTYSEVMPFNFHPFQKEVVSNIQYICPCSEFGANYLIKKYPHCKDKILVKYLGTLDHGVHKYNDDNKIKIVTCSGFRPIKRVSLFANAFSILNKKYKNLIWVCIGDGEQRGEIESFIKQSELNEFVEMYGNISNDSVLDLYKNDNIYCLVNTSYSEGMPVSIMEAYSFGIPAIATDVGGTSEIVNEKNGVLLQKDIDAESLSAEIESFLKLSPKKYIEKRISARESWNKKFNAQSNYLNWADFLFKNAR